MKEDFIYAKLVPELYVCSIEESLKFYTEILGFNICYGRKEDKFAYIDLQGSQFMLVEFYSDDNPWVLDKLEKPFGRGINFQVEVNNLKEIYTRIKKFNCKLFLDYHEKSYRNEESMLVVEQFIIIDPNGYLLRFQQDIRTEKITYLEN